jgi:electron transfer flavoprotein alpha subunit
MIALVPVRDGVLPAGADETIAECDGVAILAGSGLDDVGLEGLAVRAHLVELGDVEPGRWSAALSAVIGTIDASGAESIVLPNAPDGRDLAPRLAAAMNLPLLAGATTVSPRLVRVARRGGLELHEIHPTGRFVATLQPGVRGAEPFTDRAEVTRHDVDADRPPDDEPLADARVVEVLPPDVRTMDLTEAATIVGGGAGLDSEERFAELDSFAERIGGVMGATRVITDRGWVHHDRQIGTTGVVVDPTLYLSFGVSGAVQHTSGLGTPDHVISVNTDPHCPMMAMSDLAIVSDANATLDALMVLLDTTADDRTEAPA